MFMSVRQKSMYNVDMSRSRMIYLLPLQHSKLQLHGAPVAPQVGWSVVGLGVGLEVGLGLGPGVGWEVGLGVGDGVGAVSSPQMNDSLLAL